MMKSIVCFLTLLLASQVASAGLAFIGVDGVPTNYTADTGEFSITGRGLVIIVGYKDGSDQGAFTSSIFEMTTFREAGSYFEGGTFQFVNGSTVLLSGNVTSLNLTESDGDLAARGKAEVLGGVYEDDFMGMSDIISLTFWIAPSFESFDKDFSGYSKVNFLVPEPATLSILGLGGLALLRRRR